MKKNLKSYIISISLVAVAVVGVTVFINVSGKELPIERVSAKYAIDINDPEAVIGFSDYVFIGHVNKELGTTHEYAPDKSGNGDPVTTYSVTVLENIKGVLTQEESIEVEKFGGVSKDGKSILLMEDDALLENGSIYIFSAKAGEDGKLFCSSPTDTINVDETLTKVKASNVKNEAVSKKINNSKMVKEYKKSAKTEKKYNSDRYISKYDKSGMNIEVGTPYETAVSQTENELSTPYETAISQTGTELT